jgi:hypothetical protein
MSERVCERATLWKASRRVAGEPIAWVFVIAALAACTKTHEVTITTSFLADQHGGTGEQTSPLAALENQTITVEVDLDGADVYHIDTSDPPGCHSTYIEDSNSIRIATGSAASTVKAQVLDPLPDWYVRVQLCDTTGSNIAAVATIDALNLQFGCAGVPMGSQLVGGDGYPELVSVEATNCSATILDVVNNLVIGNGNFTMTIVTGPAHVP